MVWLIGILAALALVGAVYFGGVGGFTFVMMLVVLIVGAMLFKHRAVGAVVLMTASALPALAQTTGENTGGGAWWGGLAWMLITLVFLVGAIVLFTKGLQRPNRH